MECPVCGWHCMEWDIEFSFEDLGIEGNGIVSEYHCKHCGTEMILQVPSEDNEDFRGVEHK